MNLTKLLSDIEVNVKPEMSKGKVADYIPALAAIDANQFAMSVLLTKPVESSAFCPLKSAADESITNVSDKPSDFASGNFPAGNLFQTGCADKRFSIQSISKVLTLAMLMSAVDDEQNIWRRLGKEPSGMAFNSLIQLEMESGIPRNPLINAGAIVVADLLTTYFDNPLSSLQSFINELVGHEISFDGVVATSEKHTGHRNFSLAYLMKSFSNIHNDVDKVLDIYFNQCSLSLSTNELVQAFSFLANDGINPLNNKRVVTQRQCRRINALMLTCGTYDRAGAFAFHVGLPAKSGVGGGIVAIVPDEAVVSVWSPALGKSGNSVAGMMALELFTQQTNMGIF